ncbi:MAG: aldo/keto reductase [Planctomycetes bacterium]|nr:aldo/keto reductase [Planctomycetota bacterium]
MEYRKLGRSDLSVSAVSLGTWVTGGWWWGGADEAQSIDAIRRSIDLGINLIDTAPAYGFGRSEEIVGRAIRGLRDRVLVATKCGLRWDREGGELFFETKDQDGQPRAIRRNLSRESVIEECEASLRRLGVDVIDLYQCHWPDPTTPLAETLDALSALQRQGKIRAIGVSNFTPAMLEECLRHGAIASDQPKYNMLARDIEGDVLPFARAHDIGIIAYSPLEQGILTGKVTLDRSFPEGDYRRDRPWFQPHNRRKALALLSKLEPIARAHGWTPGQLAIHWLIGQEGVTSAIVGARTPAQAEENARAAEGRLSAEELAQIRRWLDETGGPE